MYTEKFIRALKLDLTVWIREWQDTNTVKVDVIINRKTESIIPKEPIIASDVLQQESTDMSADKLSLESFVKKIKSKHFTNKNELTNEDNEQQKITDADEKMYNEETDNPVKISDESHINNDEYLNEIVIKHLKNINI